MHWDRRPTVNVQCLNESIITCLLLNTTNTCSVVLALSINQGEGRGRLFEGGAYLKFWPMGRALIPRGAIIWGLTVLMNAYLRTYGITWVIYWSFWGSLWTGWLTRYGAPKQIGQPTERVFRRENSQIFPPRLPLGSPRFFRPISNQRVCSHNNNNHPFI